MYGNTGRLEEISRRGAVLVIEDLRSADLYRPHVIGRCAENGVSGGTSAPFILFPEFLANRVPSLSLCRFRIRVAEVLSLSRQVGVPVLLLLPVLWKRFAERCQVKLGQFLVLWLQFIEPVLLGLVRLIVGSLPDRKQSINLASGYCQLLRNASLPGRLTSDASRRSGQKLTSLANSYVHCRCCRQWCHGNHCGDLR